MTERFRRKYAAFAAAVVTSALALSACSGSGDSATSPATSSTAGATSAPSDATSPATGDNSGGGEPAAKPINPLTGQQPSKNGVVAVKIDDTGNGRPQSNIDKADNVFIEQVEAGLTRLLAVYNSTLPTTVEPVRSTRASDPELVAPYGKIGYVTSGGASNPLKLLHNSDLKYAINDEGASGFARDNNRYAPYNLTANLAAIAKRLHAPKARSVGRQWSYDTAQISSGQPGLHVRTTVGSTPVAFDWNSSLKRYVRLINGVPQKSAAGNPVAATNVLVQFCKVRPYYRNVDVNGNPSKYTNTVGTGKAVLFRNAHRITGTWTRKYYNGGWKFETTNGKAMLFRPGNVWTVLVAYQTPLG